MNATIGSDSLVEFKAQSNSFYVNSGTSGSTTTTATRSSAGTVITSTGQAIPIKGPSGFGRSSLDLGEEYIEVNSLVLKGSVLEARTRL